MKSKLYKWYERHDKVINAFVQIGQHLPGGGILKGILDVVNGKITDTEEEIVKAHGEHVEHILRSVQGSLRDLVEDVEHLKGYQQNLHEKELVHLIKKESNISKELEEAMPELATTITHSINVLRSTELLNEPIMHGKYIIQGYIGSGLQGTVYKGYNTIIDENVALKILPKSINEDQKKINSIKKEYKRLLNKLTHKNIVQYRDFDFSYERNQWFICMDYIEGKTLRNYISTKKSRRFSIEEIYNLLHPVAEALEYAHSQGVVHCDVKPENIIISEKTNIYLTDFGLAKDLDSTSQTFGQEFGGTLPYMAPEQYKGDKFTSATDTWSLAVIVYEMFAGKRPFEGKNIAHYSNIICHEPAEPLENIQLWKQLEEALHKNYEQRMNRPLLLLEQLLYPFTDTQETLDLISKKEDYEEVCEEHLESNKVDYEASKLSTQDMKEMIISKKGEHKEGNIERVDTNKRFYEEIEQISPIESKEEREWGCSFSKLSSLIKDTNYVSIDQDENIQKEEKYLQTLIAREQKKYEANEDGIMDLSTYINSLHKTSSSIKQNYISEGKSYFYDKEYEQAKKYFRMSSDHYESLFYLAYMYTHKEIEPYLPEYPLQLINKCMEENIPNGDVYYLFAMMAEFGYGMPKNLELAYEAYKRSLELETCDEQFSFERNTGVLLQSSNLYYKAQNIDIEKEEEKDEYLIWNSFFAAKGNYQALFACIRRLTEKKDNEYNNTKTLLSLSKAYSQLAIGVETAEFDKLKNHNHFYSDYTGLSNYTYQEEASIILEELEIKEKMNEEEELEFYVRGIIHNFINDIYKKYGYYSSTNISGKLIDLEILKRCADGGNIEAMLFIGSVCSQIKDNSEFDTDFVKESIYYYKKAAELGDIWAINKLGTFYKNQMNNFQSFEKNTYFSQQAYLYYKKGTEKGNLESIYQIGELCEINDYGITPNYAEAFSCYQVAAKRGHIASIEKIIAMYKEGRGIIKDEEKGKQWQEFYDKLNSIKENM